MRLFRSMAKLKKSTFFLFFAFIFNNKSKTQSQKMAGGGAVYISMRRTLHGSDFAGFLNYLRKKEDGM